MMKKKSKKRKLQTKATADQKPSNKLKIYLGSLIAVFAFILYEQSIQFEFTLDDGPAISDNSVTTQGIAGIPTLLKTDYWYGRNKDELRGPVYRPVPLIVYAIIWQIAPNDPHAYHFINVLVYSVTCLLLFLVLCKLFKSQNLLFAFICTLLYTAHPIHTEVVNSIKSLDEILCFLFAIISMGLLVNNTSSKSWWSMIFGGLAFFLSLISKETGIAFLVVIPMSIYFFTESSFRKIGGIFFLLLLITGLWLMIRMLVFGDLPDNSGNTSSVLNNTLNAAPDKISRLATLFYILLRYVLLLFYPHPLSYDYSYSQIKIHSPGDPSVLIAIILYSGMAVYSIINIRKKKILAFGSLFFLITLAPVSNLFFPVAATMAERFLFIPSLGFCIVLAYFLIKLTKAETVKRNFQNFFHFFAANYRVFLIVLLITVLYSIKTTSRSKDWKDNLTLFRHDVKISANSARANQILGSALMISGMSPANPQQQAELFSEAKIYLKRALEIYPGYFASLSHLGVIYLYQRNFDSAKYCLRKGLTLMPNDVDLNFNYGLLLFNLNEYDEAIRMLSRTIELKPDHENARYNLAAIYQNTGSYDDALLHYSKVIELNPNNANAYYNTGVILRRRGDTNRAIEYINKARSLGHSGN